MLLFVEKWEGYNAANGFESLSFASIIASVVYNWLKAEVFQAKKARMGSCMY